MIVERIIYVVLGLLLVTGTAAAIDLSASNISISNTGWLVANGGTDQSFITVFAKNASASPQEVSGAIVNFAIDPASAGMGTVTPSVTTGSDGKAMAVFSTGTKSGTAIIHATVTYPDGSTVPVNLQVTQMVDHNYPARSNYTFLNTVTVGTKTPITIQLTDRNGNPIDNLNNVTVHTIVLDTSASPGGEAFFNISNPSENLGSHVVLYPDVTGTVQVLYQVSTVAGSNSFIMQPIGSINDGFMTIKGVGDATPAYILQTLPPYGSNQIPADATSVFTLTYTVLDKYGNPCGTTINLSASDGTKAIRSTDPTSGQYTFNFGPEPAAGNYLLSVSAPANLTNVSCDTGQIGTCTYPVVFYNTDPVDIVITANPEGLASLDVDSTSHAIIQATVVDAMGNPYSKGDLIVMFDNTSPAHPGGPFNVTQYMSFTTPKTVHTGTTGMAFLTVKPEAFNSNPAALPYSSAATGKVNVSANFTYNGKTVTENVTIIWKNYPFISVSSDSTCQNKRIGDEINITIKLAGDGAAMKPKPIDAILVMDNSGSMQTDPAIAGPYGSARKIFYANVSGYEFVSKMNTGTDRIGLVTFSSEPSLKAPLATDFTDVKAKLKLMAGSGTTNERNGTFTAIREMIANKSPGTTSVKAIVFMTDGKYNQDGDPLARGTGTKIHTSEGGMSPGSPAWSGANENDWFAFSQLSNPTRKTDPRQDMAEYAKENGFVIYTVTLGSDVASGWAYDANKKLAEDTGGQIFHADDGYELVDVYAKIAGLLQDTAGGEAKVDLDFSTADVNGNASATNLTDYMDYVAYPVPYGVPSSYNIWDSTYYNMSHKNILDGSMTINWTATGERDDTTAWKSKSMHFDVGEMKLNDYWMANFRLKLNQSGDINLFGPTATSSVLSFKDNNGNIQTSTIPSIHCYIPPGSAATYFDYNLSVHGPGDTVGAASNPIPDHWLITWTTDYDGKPAMQGTATLNYYNSIDGTRNVVTQVPISPGTGNAGQGMIDTTDHDIWRPGETYCVEVIGKADGTGYKPGDTSPLCRKMASTGTGQYIKLE